MLDIVRTIYVLHFAILHQKQCRQHGRVFKSAVIGGKRDRHKRGSKCTRAILLCPLERHFTELSSARRSYEAVLNSGHIFK